LLLAGGHDGLTIGKISASLDYTKGALYRYFSSKDALLSALQVQSLERVRGRFSEVWARAQRELRVVPDEVRSLAMIGITARAYVALEAELPADFALIRLAVGESRPLLPESDVQPVVEAMLVLLREVAALIEQAESVHSLQPGPALSRAVELWAAIHGNVLIGKFARFDPELFSASGRVESLTQSLLIGWGADQNTVVAALQASLRVT
jgi:AcrR family transcriptional regulator